MTMTSLARITLLVSLAVLGGPRARALELEVTGLDGKALRGQLVQVWPEIVLASAEGETALAWSQVLALRPLGVEPPAAEPARADPLRFELADGSIFGGRIAGVTERGFTVELPAGRRCQLEPTLLRAIHSTSASAAAQAKLAAVSTDANRTEDVAVVERGRKVIELRGAVRRIDSQGVLFAWNERELSLPWERVAGLSFARPTARRASCTVRLRGGDAFCGRVIAGGDSGITLQSGIFERLELDWSRIERIECHSRQLVFLSDLVPPRYEFTPFFLKQWDYARDETLTGRAIRLAGRRYAKGLTMHSRASLAYSLDGQYRQFAALVGIADEMADRGDATLAVLGDGRILWQATSVRGSEPPRGVLVDVTGVRELSLHVDFGAGLDVSDHVCWAGARLIR